MRPRTTKLPSWPRLRLWLSIGFTLRSIETDRPGSPMAAATSKRCLRSHEVEHGGPKWRAASALAIKVVRALPGFAIFGSPGRPSVRTAPRRRGKVQKTSPRTAFRPPVASGGVPGGAAEHVADLLAASSASAAGGFYEVANMINRASLDAVGNVQFRQFSGRPSLSRPSKRLVEGDPGEPSREPRISTSE